MQTMMIRFTGMALATLLLVPTILAQQSQSATENDDQVLALQNKMPEKDSEAYTLLNQVIELNFQNASLEEALNSIANQANLKLMYRKTLLSEDIKVSYRNSSKTIYDALWDILDGTGIQFAISQNRQLVLLRMRDVESVLDIEVQETVTGQVTDAITGESLPGVNIILEGTTTGTTTDPDGNFEFQVPSLQETLVFTYIGYASKVINIDGRTELNIELTSEIISGDELVVVGYGVQRRSDITGSVSSIPSERLDMLPNQNIAQAIQGAVPGVMIRTTSAGAVPNQALMVRGRNSIEADNTPLIVVDGVQYSGNLTDINPTDVESIEILKDASAAAIYGSRGSNGVILITTKEGTIGDPRISYESRISRQSFAELPNMMDGEEFYDFKMLRFPEAMTQSEQEIYEEGEWTDWLDLGLRSGFSTEHHLSVSGATERFSYYISGGFLDVQGIAVNDNFQRITGRINVDTEIAGWLSIGTRTNISYDDQSGVPVQVSGSSGIYRTNPLTRPYDEDGNLTIYHWADDQSFTNPLAPTLYDDINTTNQIVSNNFVEIDFPFISGLTNRMNTGIRFRSNTNDTYQGRNTRPGLENRGVASVYRSRGYDITFENILSFNRDFGVHNIFATGVLSYEENERRSESMRASGFPNDMLTWYAIEQAEALSTSLSFDETYLISNMLRINYAYDSRYLVTITGRRDGFSGFGADNKWGLFPSLAIAWNLAEEGFFPWEDLFNELKPKISWGLNGNHAVGAYASMTRLSERNIVSAKTTQPGFTPARLGQPDLGWEASQTLNVGLDFALLEDRVSGDINFYRTKTSDLLLNRTISGVHGISSIIQNIGETENRGFEVQVNSFNIRTGSFLWSTTANMSFNKNKIVDLYGDGRDDVANAWFIGEPINVNFDYIWEGTWQLDEAEEAAVYGQEPGMVKLRDVTGEGQITADDRQIIGQTDPQMMWGLSNSFSYRSLTMNVFIHGVHGVRRANPFMSDYTFADIRQNTTVKNWWTPDNPTNEWVRKDHLLADQHGGIRPGYYESASFIRVKDISLSYDLPQEIIGRFGINRLRVYTTASNLHTFTEWGGLDPELSGQHQIPLQREFVIGINLEF